LHLSLFISRMRSRDELFLECSLKGLFNWSIISKRGFSACSSVERVQTNAENLDRHLLNSFFDYQDNVSLIWKGGLIEYLIWRH
jgi:hypothetical protein